MVCPVIFQYQVTDYIFFLVNYRSPTRYTDHESSDDGCAGPLVRKKIRINYNSSSNSDTDASTMAHARNASAGCSKMTAKSRPVPPKSSAPSMIVSPLLAQAGNASAEGIVNIFIHLFNL